MNAGLGACSVQELAGATLLPLPHLRCSRGVLELAASLTYSAMKIGNVPVLAIAIFEPI